MRKVIEDDLGEPLEEVFSEFGEEAVAAASIGQVYRASLRDGRDVAVKVQYPGVANAVRADLQNLGLIMRVAKRIAPGMDAKAMTAEIRERLTDELDYEHEAQQHRAFARTWRNHPFIYIPGVVTELCTEHVLVTEWVDGIGFEQVRELDAATRDRFGEIVFRFFFGSLYRNGHFSGDPHPGNYRLMGDGRVAFIDFGMTKRVSREDLDAEVAAVHAAMDGDAEELHRRLAAVGFFDPADEQVTPQAVFEHFHDVTAWYIEDREVTIDRALVSRVMIDLGDPRSRHWQLMKRETMPPQAMLARRMEALTLGVLGQLGATANWHRIAREWLFDDPPSTELGVLEHPFHDRAAA
jgi:predicted unusual protein kinase regulating ubiquinone biosynthesis (AarF/ABC1/UbiB family)